MACVILLPFIIYVHVNLNKLKSSEGTGNSSWILKSWLLKGKFVLQKDLIMNIYEIFKSLKSVLSTLDSIHFLWTFYISLNNLDIFFFIFSEFSTSRIWFYLKEASQDVFPAARAIWSCSRISLRDIFKSFLYL